ncbi:DinB family protein [Actinopolymorpha rutila]|uniref:Putative damage-inducible protein DinB n=1 Tax=Actinopolymorpha rutila TaxID=446787 RepID=A0A852Z4E8_9ACTN|nr:DinB family protein [Actinopolymorpha rutila]NYH87834.1 putative damage-inducible protein DinB [Actinopolymorpha rutila]
MAWTAPQVERGYAEPLAGGERAVLDGWLDWHRTTLLHKCAGLTGEQLALRAIPASNLSLLGLLRHVAEVERMWFRRKVGGENLPELYPAGVDFDDADGASAEADYATLVGEMAASRAAAAGVALDTEFAMEGWGRQVSLRWIHVHLIEEYARHNGHADLLRQNVDGATGV